MGCWQFNTLLPDGQGSNSVMQADWLEASECNILLEYYDIIIR